MIQINSAQATVRSDSNCDHTREEIQYEAEINNHRNRRISDFILLHCPESRNHHARKDQSGYHGNSDHHASNATRYDDSGDGSGRHDARYNHSDDCTINDNGVLPTGSGSSGGILAD